MIILEIFLSRNIQRHINKMMRCQLIFDVSKPGNIWVYGALNKVETDEEKRQLKPAGKEPVPNPNYCNAWVYWLAFFMITMVYVMIILMCCLLCALGVIVSRSKNEENGPIMQDNEAPNYTEGNGPPEGDDDNKGDATGANP